MVSPELPELGGPSGGARCPRKTLAAGPFIRLDTTPMQRDNPEVASRKASGRLRVPPTERHCTEEQTKVKQSTLASGLVAILCAGCSPRITNIVPYAARPGERVMIHGYRLTEGTDPESVDFNGTPGTFFAPAGESVEAEVPAGATSGRVHIGALRGLATSPSDFTVVVTEVEETEPNNDRARANVIGENGIRGTILGASDDDWFRIATGPAGPYGYTLEVHASTEGMPDGVGLRVLIQSSADETLGYLCVGPGGDDPPLAWTAQPADTHIGLRVESTGSTHSARTPIRYHIAIAKIPIDDTNERDNDIDHANPVSPGTAHTGSYLCDVDDLRGPTVSDDRDYYSFELLTPRVVTVTLADAGLRSPASAYVGLYTPDGTLYAGPTAYGTTEAVGVVVDLPRDYVRPHPPFPAGTWYVLVMSSMSLSHCGEGSAPVRLKRPYRLLVDLD